MNPPGVFLPTLQYVDPTSSYVGFWGSGTLYGRSTW